MNYYEILNIDSCSCTKTVKKHYYSLAKKYHPDKNPNVSDDDFKLLSEAYTTLSNPRKRYLYDLKLELKENLGDDFVHHFSDAELELLDSFYKKLKTSTEFKFLKLLYESLPKNVQRRFRKKFNNRPCEALLNISELKYIWAQDLLHDYTLYLKRNLKDVYHNLCKEIIVICKSKVYHLFITHSDYLMTLYNTECSNILLNIETILPEKYTLNGQDLYYNHSLNLYEYYFTDAFHIRLLNELNINLKNTEEFNVSVKIKACGLKDQRNKRGNLYIYKNLDLKIPKEYLLRYKSILKEIFC